MKSIFGIFLATSLFGLYVITWGIMLWALIVGKPEYSILPGNEGFYYVASTVAGISSALAIAVLGVTPPNKALNAGRLGARALSQEDEKNINEILTTSYLMGWLFIGLLAVIFGLMVDPPDSVMLVKEKLQAAEGLRPNAANNAQRAITADDMAFVKIYDLVHNFAMTWFGMALSAVYVYFKVNPDGQKS